MAPPKLSPPEQLRKLTTPTTTQAEIARELRVSTSLVSAWLAGTRIPTEEHQRILRERYGVRGTWPAPVREGAQ